jgi:hypothetical protein
MVWNFNKDFRVFATEHLEFNNGELMPFKIGGYNEAIRVIPIR